MASGSPDLQTLLSKDLHELLKPLASSLKPFANQPTQEVVPWTLGVLLLNESRIGLLRAGCQELLPGCVRAARTSGSSKLNIHS